MTAQTFRAQHSFVVNPSPPPRMERPAVAEAPMTDPTLLKTQGRRRKRGSGLKVAVPAAIAVALVGGAGLWALTRPHSEATAPPNPVVAAAAANALAANDQANSAAAAAQNDAATAQMASAKAAEDKAAQAGAAQSEALPVRPVAHHHAAPVTRHRAATAASEAGADASATSPAPVPQTATAPMSQAPATALPAPQMVPAPTIAQPVNPPVMPVPSTATQPQP